MGGYAWVTLATNDSYSLGALVLAHSLKQAATQQQLAVLITPGVTNSMRKKLAEIFNVVKEVNILDSKDEANLRLLKRPELGITFTKLHCWRLTQFEKCVFLDADTLVLENCDELFEREELSAAPDIGWPDCFNSGVFVYRPSNETYEKLINFALEKGSFDGGDQGLLNLYFSDWAHKDISKHLPFIYNMASTACYSYLPAFKQYGKNAKILHFIGSSKPWLQYFNTETRKVHPSEGLQHLEQILQHWWNIFCNLIHPALSPDMTSHTDTVHGSQSYTSQSISHTSYYHNYEHNPSSQIPETAEDYQNVWDPWEEYDSRQSGNKPPDSTGHDHPTISEQSPSSQSHYEHYHQSSEMHVDSHTHTEHSEPQSNYFEHKSSHVENRAPESHCEHSQIENNSPHNQHFENHNQYHDHFDSAVSENQHFEQKGLDNKNVHNDEPGHNVVMRQNSHNQHQQNLIESHNTNTFSNADHHVHIHHPSVPTYISQPQIPIIQHQPPETPNQDCSSYNTPPDDPRLPDECVATTTVSNAITLKSDSNEDTNQNQAGLAGAFAKLTLGEARTPEQQALDDHLRRQGWEVGNIDYLGRDSFDNIWSKICETLSITAEAESTPSIVENITEPSTQKEASPEKLPEPSTQKETSPEKVETVELLQTSPLPEPDKTESTTDRSPVESKKKIKLEVTSETSTAIQSSDSYAKETKSVAVAPLSPEIKPLPTPVPDASAQPPKADNVAKIAQSGIVESSPGEQSTPETKETPPTILESPKANYCKTEISTVTQSPVTTSSEVQSVAEPPKAQEVVIPQEISKAAEVPKYVPEKSAQSVSAQPPLTTPAEPSKTVLQAVPKEIPVESPKATPIETLKAAPTESSKISPTGTAEDESTSKTTPAEPLKTTPAEPPKTTPAEAPKTTPAEAPKTTPTETPKVTSAELTKTISAEKPKTDTVSAAPVESPKAVAAEMPKSVPTETPKAVVPEASEGIPEKSPKSEPVETPKTAEETSKDASTAIAITSTTKNVKTSKITPAESPKVSPVETIKAEPVETKEVSKKGSKGKQTPETKEVPKKVTSKEAAQVPVSKVIEPTPPTTPGSPQTPQTTEPLSPVAIAGLKIEGSVPNTPPPQETASVPTPPPRKSAGAPKKAAAKKK